MDKKLRVLEILDSIMDRPGKEAKGPELMFYCPFCGHHKRKLQVNVDTQQWHCWVCDAKGRSVFTLSKKLNAPKQVYSELNTVFLNSTIQYGSAKTNDTVKLPKQFKSLTGKTSGIVFSHAKKYLISRGLSEYDIIKYNIGFCIDGEYGGRIIVPSYDCHGRLNYFVGRSIYPGKLKYKNPPTSKDTIIFEQYINWDFPVILCEGVFDAMAIKRNAIPLFGKNIPNTLMEKLIFNKVKNVNLAFDPDALETSVKISQRLMKYGINVTRTLLEDGDPSELGYEKMLQHIRSAQSVDVKELILQKIASGSI